MITASAPRLAPPLRRRPAARGARWLALALASLVLVSLVPLTAGTARANFFICKGKGGSPSLLGYCKDGSTYAPVHMGWFLYGAYTERDFYGGFQVAFANWVGGSFRGLIQGSPWSLFNRVGGRFEGHTQLGWVNVNEEYFGVLQIGVIWNHARKHTGMLQVGPVNTAKQASVIQVGLYNDTDDFSGLQVGVINLAQEVRGVQVGAYNQARRLYGVQLGLINRSEETGLPFMLLLNVGW